MARTVEQIAPETFGVLIYQLLVQVASLRAEVERLQEQLAAQGQEKPPPVV